MNYICRLCNVTAILCLRYMLHIM